MRHLQPGNPPLSVFDRLIRLLFHVAPQTNADVRYSALPVEALHVEVKRLSIVVAHLGPQPLRVVILEFPLVRCKVYEGIARVVDFLVDLP